MLSSTRMGPCLAAAVLFANIGFSVATACAETIQQALASAYRNSPALRAQRQQLRIADEDVSIANSNWRPKVSFQVDAGYESEKSFIGARDFEGDVSGYRIELSQPVFRGLRTISEVRQTDALVHAGRQELLAVEQRILLDAATAYLNLTRDQKILSLRKRAVALFQRQYNTALSRFKIEDITRTDVSLAKASLMASRANLENGFSDVDVSKSNYTRFVGHPPTQVKLPRTPKVTPKTLRSALLISQRLNPDVRKAIYKEIAARHFIEVKRGDMLPKVTVEAELERRIELSTAKSESRDMAVRGVLTIPLYQSGRASAEVRKAKAGHSRRQLLILDQRRKTAAQVSRVWRRMREARHNQIIRFAEIEANAMAVTGMEKELTLGTRTLDAILDRQREMINAQAKFIRAERDGLVRAYELLASIGYLTAKRLRLPVERYDPLDYHRRQRDRRFGTHLTAD